MSSYRRNDSVGRLRDVHQLDGAMLVSYGIKFHEDMALLTNKLAKEISGRELLRKLYPTSDIAFCSGNGDDRVLARARNSRAMVPVRPSPSLAKLLNLTTVRSSVCRIGRKSLEDFDQVRGGDCDRGLLRVLRSGVKSR